MKCVVFFFNFYPLNLFKACQFSLSAIVRPWDTKNKLTQILNKVSNNDEGKNLVNLMKPL